MIFAEPFLRLDRISPLQTNLRTRTTYILQSAFALTICNDGNQREEAVDYHRPILQNSTVESDFYFHESNDLVYDFATDSPREALTVSGGGGFYLRTRFVPACS